MQRGWVGGAGKRTIGERLITPILYFHSPSREVMVAPIFSILCECPPAIGFIWEAGFMWGECKRKVRGRNIKSG